MTLRLIALFAALLGLAAAVPAQACSVSSDYVRPTNFELVQIADAIIVATPEDRAGEDSLRFRVVQTVKGAPPQQLVLPSAMLGAPPPSDLVDLSTSNPEGYAGPCNRMSFRVGSRYLLFLTREANGQWRQLGFPFSRINEDYRGENNAWMRTVRRYLALQQRLDPMAQIEALEAMRASGRTADSQVLEAGERVDIADHLSAISQWKPTAWLLRAWAQLERGQNVVARPDSANREAGDVDALVGLALGEPASRAAPDERQRVRIALLNALATGTHPDAMPLFERLSAAPGTSLAERGAILRYFARHGRFPIAYAWIRTQLMTQLVSLERQDAQRLLLDVGQVMHGDDQARARWRADPDAAASWPQLALALYWYQVRTFGPDRAYSFPEAIDAIPVTDYRAHPLLTLALARRFDERVTAWAVAELARPLPPAARNVDDETRIAGDLLPLHVLVSNWSSERVAVLSRLFCERGLRRRVVIRAIGQWGDDLYHELLARMAGAPDFDRDDRTVMLRAAVEMAARDVEARGRSGYPVSNPEEWLVTRMLGGQPTGQPPLTCPA